MFPTLIMMKTVTIVPLLNSIENKAIQCGMCSLECYCLFKRSKGCKYETVREPSVFC